MMYQIIDNVLSKRDFLSIKNYFINRSKWYYNNSIVSKNDVGSHKTEDYMFNHLFYRDEPFTLSENISSIIPIFKELNIKKLIRCKSNFYAKTEKIIEHDYHIDFPFPHLVALYYVNTNNGYTIFKNGNKIESIENRLLIFDGSIEHASTTSSDNVRINININFIQNDNKKENSLIKYS